jgi:hypothetical protein
MSWVRSSAPTSSASGERHDTFYLNFYKFYRNCRTSSDTKKKGSTIWSNTLAIHRSFTEPKLLRSPIWFAAPWSSLSQILYKTQVMHTHESSNIDNLHSWNIRCSDRKAQSSHFIYKMYRAWSPSLPSQSSTNQTAHRAWSLGFYSYSITFSNMVTDANCSCFAGY